MTKDAYYFSHDANSRHDPKCLKLQAKFGMEGYGIFWVIIETLREHTDYKMPLSDIDAINMDCKSDAKALIMYCIEIGLLESDDTLFWAPALLRRMAHLDEVREKRKQSALIRWDNKAKQSKVKKSKVKESRLHSKSNAKAMQKHKDILYTDLFLSFWNDYTGPNKTPNAKAPCFKIWVALSEQEQMEAIGKLGDYIAQASEPKYIAKPSRYLSEKLWQADFESTKPSNKITPPPGKYDALMKQAEEEQRKRSEGK